MLSPKILLSCVELKCDGNSCHGDKNDWNERI